MSHQRPNASNSNPVGSGEYAQLHAYREWALQQSSASLFDAGASWRGRPEVLGPGDDGEMMRGQGELRRMLEPEDGRAMRIKTMMLLGAGGLAAATVNRLAGVGDQMELGQYVAICVAIALTMVAIVTLAPRLSARNFAILEQAAMLIAWAIVASACALTGGAESPFIVWWLFPVSYSAYFMPRKRVYANAVAVAALSLLPLFYDPSGRDAESLLTLILMANVNLAVAAMIAIGRALTRNAERAMRFLALADPLTGVANLRSFESVIERLSSGDAEPFTLVLVEMRGLKGANASFGYEAGDDMLRRTAALMLHSCSEHDQVARLHGDEFAVLIRAAGKHEMAAWCDRFETTVAEHNDWVRGRLPRISVMIGGAQFPGDGSDPETIFRAADDRLAEQRALAVKPPYEVDLPASSIREMLRSEQPPDESATKHRLGSRKMQDGVRWLLAAALFTVWALVPGTNVDNPYALLALAAVAAALAALNFVVRGETAATIMSAVSDWARLVVIVPLIWLSGGWQSPLQIATFFPLIFYAQFTTGRVAVVRIFAVVGLYAFAFWGAESAGAVDGPPTAAASELFTMTICAQLVIAFLIQMNRRTAQFAISRVERASTYDPLTSVFNVRSFRGELTVAVDAASRASSSTAPAPASVAGREPVPALAIVDIDDFRVINSRDGHLAGDDVLRSTADTVQSLIGESGTVFRIDSDEFAVLTKCEEPEGFDELVAQLRRSLDPIPAESVAGRVRASVGGAMWHRHENVETLMEAARDALDADRRAHASEQSAEDGPTLL